MDCPLKFFSVTDVKPDSWPSATKRKSEMCFGPKNGFLNKLVKQQLQQKTSTGDTKKDD